MMSSRLAGPPQERVPLNEDLAVPLERAEVATAHLGVHDVEVAAAAVGGAVDERNVLRRERHDVDLPDEFQGPPGHAVDAEGLADRRGGSILAFDRPRRSTSARVSPCSCTTAVAMRANGSGSTVPLSRRSRTDQWISSRSELARVDLVVASNSTASSRFVFPCAFWASMIVGPSSKVRASRRKFGN